jgi:hypothetical protein
MFLRSLKVSKNSCLECENSYLGFQKRNLFLFSSKDKKNAAKNKGDVTEEELGNVKGLVYTMRKDAKLAQKERTS